MVWNLRTSIHGRRFGISSSGGLIADPAGSTVGSTGFAYNAQMWGPGMVASHTSTAEAISLRNVGTQVISSATSTAVVASIRAAPVAGQELEVAFLCTATAITLNTNSTTVVFQTTGASSTSMTGGAAGGARGETVVLRAVSATRWLVTRKTAGIS